MTAGTPVRQSILDDLAAQRHELATLRRELAALQQSSPTSDKAKRRTFGTRPRRWLPVLFMVGLLAIVPAALGASDRFTDVPTDAFYHDDATAIANAGVTEGCGDGSIFCPEDFVTRGEMASFLARLGGLGGNPPVANAATLNGVALEDIETMPGPQGPIGPVGPQGPPGATGPAGPASTNIVSNSVAVNTSGADESLTVECGVGELVVGGGYTYPADELVTVRQNYPSSTTAWTFSGSASILTGNTTVTVYAICAPAAATP